MKKRILIGLALITSFFVLGGIFLIVTIERTTFALNNLIDLHRVEILREQLLANARKIQSGLSIHHSHPGDPLDALVANMLQLEDQANKCLECHHNADTTRELGALKEQISTYKEAFGRVLAARPDAYRMEFEASKALALGYTLVNRLHDMTALTYAALEKRTEVTLKDIGNMKVLIFILIVMGPIFAIGLAIIIVRGLTGPLSALMRATKKLKSGDLSYRVRGLSDEFGEMATAFNEMAAALHQQVHQMQRAEQMTMVGELAAGLAHEIKNPLAGIKGAMQVLQDAARITEEERAILSQAIHEVQRVEALLKNMLDFAKPPKPQLITVNINDILGATVDTSIPYTSPAPESPKTIRVVKRFDPHLPMIMADPLVIQQAFLNLLMNARQAMPAGGTLTVMTFEDALTGEIHIEIADTGVGISGAIKEKIFQPFFTTKHKGTGLGLAISKQFIEMHGGVISAAENPAGGTIFRIILPRAQGKETPLPNKRLEG
ncbi:MAG: HAMP domain-containing protein [Deltaproteobacteria bacterium]|nr:HAMP domain-containing protein [Deltaproteobacteria bacterium]